MTATIDLPSGHLDFLKALSRPTDYQKLLIELYEKQIGQLQKIKNYPL